MARYPWFVRSDLDGFFGLFVDNLVQLLLIVALCGAYCGMTGEQAWLLYARVLPGAAVSVLIGNLYYSWRAYRLAVSTGRTDVTALPYGINTPSLIVYVFAVMAPAWRRTGDAVFAWQLGLVACLGSGLIELAGSLVAERVRRSAPRAALLATLSGIAIGFIAMAFALRIWQHAVVALLPLGVILLTYFAGYRFPLGIPGGLLAVAAGTLAAWLLPAAWTGVPMSAAAVADAWQQRGLALPHWSAGAWWSALLEYPGELVSMFSIVLAMGLFNVIGSLQNIESAEAAGDAYPAGPCLAVNGLGTIAAACFGSCFPTTIYIGHPGWKALGARSGYSVLNGIVVTVLCLSGTVGLVSRLIPLEAGIPIVLWIGVIITAQAFSATPRAHAPAVALGLFPAIAAWGAAVVIGAFDVAGAHGAAPTIESVIRRDPLTEVNGFLIHGLLILQSGYVLTCMVLAAVSANLIDRRFTAAALWSLIAAVLTIAGFMHAYRLTGNTVDMLLIFDDLPAGEGLAYRGYGPAAGYVLCAVLFGLAGLRAARRDNGMAHPAKRPSPTGPPS